MGAIYERELKSYFHTMTGPVYAALSIAATGIYFMALNLTQGYPYFSYTLISTLILPTVTVPILTMRSFAEERRQKTDQLLLTSSVGLGRVVLGKYLAMCTVAALPLLVLSVCPLIISSIGTAYLATDYASLLAYFAICCMYIAVGMFISSLTESQLISAVSSFGALLLIYLWGDLVSFLPSGSGGVLATLILLSLVLALLYYLSARSLAAALLLALGGSGAALGVYLLKPDWLSDLFSRALGGFSVIDIFDNFAVYSLFDLEGLVKLLAVTGVFVFMTARQIEKRRWS